MAEETFIGYGGYANDGSDLTIFSNTGKKRSIADFEDAIMQYNERGKSPSGFVIMPSDDYRAQLRRGFEKINQPVQEGLPGVGSAVAGVLAPTGFAALGEKLGLLGQGSAVSLDASARQFGSEEGASIGEMVNTPGKAGAAAGMLAATPLLKPVSLIAGATGKAAMNKTALLSNIFTAGIGGAGGLAGFDALTGDFDTGRTAKEFGIAALGGGFQGVFNHFLTKFVSPNMREKIATDILTEVKKQYPNMINDPSVLDAYASSPQNLERITQQGIKAFRGKVDDITGNFIPEINNVLPRPLSAGENSSLRAKLKRFNTIANDMLDNIDDPIQWATSEEKLKEIHKEMVSSVVGTFSNAQQKMSPADIARVREMFTTHLESISGFKEGAWLLQKMRKSGINEGFNPQTFTDDLKGDYERNPGDIIERVGKKLGFGQRLQEMAPPEASMSAAKVFNMIKGSIPIVKHIPFEMKTPTASPILSWQEGVRMSTPVKAISQQAMKDFMNSATSGADK